jgi:hypothetical protein
MNKKQQKQPAWPVGLKGYIKRHKIKFRGEYLVLYKGVTRGFGSPVKNISRRKHPYKPGTRVVNSEGVNKNRYLPCAVGLHVGTFRCAERWADWNWGRGKVMEVLVKPEHMVVPIGAYTDSNSGDWNDKIRCSELIVVKEVQQ